MGNKFLRKQFSRKRNISFSIFLIHLLFFVLTINVYSQSAKQVKYYSERIEFGTDEVKRNALFDLRNFQTETASRVALPALKDTSVIVRATATYTVIYLPKNESANALIPLLKDEAEFVRRETAYALGKTRNPNVAIQLIALLQKDKKQSVKDAAAVSLGLIGNSIAIKTLVSVLTKKPKKKQNFFRRATAKSIGQIAESIKSQNLTVNTPQNFLPTNYKNLSKSKSAQEGLFTNVVAVLKKVLENTKEIQDVRRESAFALGAIGDKAAVQILRSNLKSEDLYLAEICEEALTKLNN